MHTSIGIGWFIPRRDEKKINGNCPPHICWTLDLACASSMITSNRDLLEIIYSILLAVSTMDSNDDWSWRIFIDSILLFDIEMAWTLSSDSEWRKDNVTSSISHQSIRSSLTAMTTEYRKPKFSTANGRILFKLRWVMVLVSSSRCQLVRVADKLHPSISYQHNNSHMQESFGKFTSN